MTRSSAGGAAAATRLIVVAGCLLATGTGPVLGQVRDRKLAERGRGLTALMYAGDLQPIWDASSAALQETLQDVQAMRQVHQQLLDTLGAETALLGERTLRQGGLDIYVRTVTFERTAGNRYLVQWAFDRTGAIQGFTIRPAP